MPRAESNLNRVAIAGASSLRGKELKQVLEDRDFPAADIVLLDESVMAGTLTEAAGEPTFIHALEEESFEDVRFAFFAGTPADAARNIPAAQRSGATVIDLTGASAESRDAAIWIPSLSSLLPPKPPAAANGTARPGVYHSPGAATIIACTISAALAKLAPRAITILLFPPVSERDQAGIEELESQTASLLSFREIAKPVFDAQVAFNLLSSYGEESTPRLRDVRAVAARQIAQYLAGRAPVPAIQFIQAPVFYGYAFAAYAAFSAAPGIGQIEEALANAGIKISPSGEMPPTNVSVAGENEIHLARIDPDPNVSGGVWLWGAADNLRLAAVNAVRIAEELLAESRIQ